MTQLASFGDCEILYDARRSDAAESAITPVVPDLSATGVNYLSNVIGSATGFGCKAGAIGGYPAYRVVDGQTGSGSLGRGTAYVAGRLTRAIQGIPVTVVCVCQFNAITANVVFDWENEGVRLLLNAGGDGTQLSFSSGAGSILSTTGRLAAATPALIVAVANGASSILRINGLQDTGTLDAVDMRTIRVGSAFGSGANFNGLLGTLAFFRGAFPAARIAEVERFVNRDWNLKIAAIGT